MPEFKQGCCQCCDMGAGSCLLTTFCPCIAFYQAAQNIGDDGAIVYLIIGFFGLNCCSLCVLGNNVAKKRNISMGLCKSGCCALLNGCTCYSCTVVAECKDMKKESAPGASAMER